MFLLSILPFFNIQIGYIPEFRGNAYVWDFELFFTSISIVWAIFLWRASSNPLTSKTFILFTIWATVAHMLAMVIVGAFKPIEAIHLFKDAGAFVIPILLVIWGYKRELTSSKSSSELH